MNPVKRISLAVALFIYLPALLQGQVRSNIGDTVVNAKLLTISYAFQFPAGDMADRFGFSNNIGGSFYFKINRNYLLGVEANYLFGGNIREDSILNKLITSSGDLIGIDGLYETVVLSERGYAFWGKFGKIIPIFEAAPNSGITLMAGAGFLQHKLKIEDVNNALPYLTGDYAKGYDRLTNGFAISQYVGYTHLDKRKLLNFSIGLEAMEAFAENL